MDKSTNNTAPQPPTIRITNALGLFGWESIEPAILAALITEEPLLLIGEHGCAKSFLLERLAEALDMQYRFYNASLINYDDLVGIPMPSSDRSSLTYITSPESIWDAEVVFIDEINRTRADLQNKLFPIINECRIQGQKLPNLHYRWAAMNPPPSDDDDDVLLYHGALPLDAALADRFTFIVPVPNWDNLTETDQESLLADQFAGRHELEIDIHQLIAEGKAQYQTLIKTTALQVIPFVTTLVNQLRGAHYDISTRRSTMIHRALLAVHAARLVTEGSNATLYDSAHIALRYTLPDRTRRAVNSAEIALICKQALVLSNMSNDNALKLLLKECNKTLRLHKLLRNIDAYTTITIAQVVGEGIAAAPTSERKLWALITYLALRTHTHIPASTIELLAVEIHDVFNTQYHGKLSHSNSAEYRLFNAIQSAMEEVRMRESDSELCNYLYNLLRAYAHDTPLAITESDVEPIIKKFTTLWRELICK